MALVPSQSADSVTHSRSGRGEDIDGHPPRSLPPKEDYLAYLEMVEKSEVINDCSNQFISRVSNR